MKEGKWISSLAKYMVAKVRKNEILFYNIALVDLPDAIPQGKFDISYGEFGPAREEIKEASGVDNYNIKLSMEVPFKLDLLGVHHEKEAKIYFWGFTNCLESYKWISPQELEKRIETFEHYESPSCPHITPKPGTSGKLFWLSGPPGSGKSTTCQLMARKNGYVYYEADCCFNFDNWPNSITANALTPTNTSRAVTQMI